MEGGSGGGEGGRIGGEGMGEAEEQGLLWRVNAGERDGGRGLGSAWFCYRFRFKNKLLIGFVKQKGCLLEEAEAEVQRDLREQERAGRARVAAEAEAQRAALDSALEEAAAQARGAMRG